MPIETYTQFIERWQRENVDNFAPGTQYLEEMAQVEWAKIRAANAEAYRVAQRELDAANEILIAAFLIELEALTRKHGVILDGEEMCALVDNGVFQTENLESGYAFNDDCNIVWAQPNESQWVTLKDSLVRKSI